MRRHTPPELLVLARAVIACVGLAACEERPGPTPTEPAPPPSVPGSGAADPALVAPADEESAWPDAVATLAESVAAHRDREHCLESLRARFPVEIAEVVADIGYDVLLDDVCNGL